MKAKELLNDRNKQLTLLNRNYLFLATILIVGLNLALFKYGVKIELPTESNGNRFLSLAPLLQEFLNCYFHSTWQHVLLNMLSCFIAGLYLERKMGSFRFLLLVIILTFFIAFAQCVKGHYINGFSTSGFSVVSYGLYGYIVMTFLFELCRKQERYSFNVISGIVILGLIYFAMCFNGSTQRVSFVWYPDDLLNSWGHMSAFAVGLVFGFYEQLCALISRGKRRRDDMK